MTRLSRKERMIKYKEILNKIIQKYNYDLKTEFQGYLKDDPMDHNIGWYEPENKTFFINFSSFEDFCNPNSQNNSEITFLIHAICHELRHAIQFSNKYPSIDNFTRFMIDIEQCFTMCNLYQNENFYNDYHDFFLLEVDAELNGIQNALNIISQARNLGMPTIQKEINFEFYRHRNNYFQYRKIAYDAPAMYERFMKFLNQKRHTSLLEMNNMPILKNFFDKDGNYYSVSRIIQNCRANKVDQNIISLVLSSNYFLNQLNYLSETELEYVLICIRITYEKYQENQKLRNNLLSSVIKSKQWLSKFFNSKIVNYKNLETLADKSYYSRLKNILLRYSQLEEQTSNYRR